METKDFLKKCARTVKSALGWIGFSVCEIILIACNLLIVGLVVYYCWRVFGPVERIEPKAQAVYIKKVDGFYLVDKRFNYDEVAFPDCSIQFIDRNLQFKDGDIYDGDSCVTDLVSILQTDGGFRVYYLNKSYPLTTITTIPWDYCPNMTLFTKLEKKEMYAKNGHFYVDADDRHGFVSFLLLALMIFIVFCARSGMKVLTKAFFEYQYDLMWNGLKSLFKKK